MSENIVVVRKSKPCKELTQTEKYCLDLILDDYTNVDAAFASGLCDPAFKDDPAERKKATGKVIRLCNTKKGKEYLLQNRKLAVVYKPTDLDSVATHMMDICMGNALHHVSTWSEKLQEQVEYDIKPSFGDQIKAAEWLRKYTADVKQDARFGLNKAPKAIEDADAAAMELVNKWKTRVIDDGTFSYGNGKTNAIGTKLNDMIEEAQVAEG